MAQSGYTPISLYFSTTGAAVPTAGNLVAGELALNTNDGKLYYKNSSGVVTLLAGATSGPAGGSNTQVQYNNSGVLSGITGATTNGTALTLVAPVLGTPASGLATNLTGLPLTTGVTGTLPVANGGTGLTAGTSGGLLAYTATGTLASSALLTLYGVVYGGGVGAVPVATAAGTTGQVLQATTGGAPVWGSTYAGSVSSVGFTGGLISVATATTTPALTVAGTSGGAVYFSSASTWASSALLSANALMIGGGSGAAPATTTTGTGVVTALGVNTGSAGAFVVNGGALGSPSSAGTIPAFTLGGTVAGGGNQLNNVIIGASTPLAGAFTTLSATGTLSGGTSGTGYSFSGSAPATSLTLDASGNLLVGITSAAAIDGVPTRAFINNSSDSALLFIKGQNSTKSSVVAVEGPGQFVCYMAASGTASTGWKGIPAGAFGLAVDSASVPLVFANNGAESARIDASGNLLVGVTTANANGGVLQLKSGITFPATQSASTDANTLDDYEEGTWTPTDGSGASLTFTGVSGSYTKVGRCVTAFAEVTYPITASGLNGVIGGLPFTSAGTGPGINGYIRYTDVSTSVITFLSGGTSGTSVSLLRPGVNTTNVSMSGGTLLFAVIYFV